MNIKYILKKLLIPIVLLIVSVIAAAGKYTSWFHYGFLEAYMHFALYVIITGIIMHFLGEAIPRKFCFDKGFFSCAGWEKDGKIYDEIFRVSKWKDLLMDASKMFTDTKTKSVSGRPDAAGTESAIQEMCAGELCHWILILAGISLLFIIRNRWKWLFWAIYTLANLSDIVIQRYNRPRLVKLYSRMVSREVKS